MRDLLLFITILPTILNSKIIVHRDQFDSFDAVLTYLYNETIQGNAALKAKRRYVTVFLHYMYFDCDIGDHA